MRFFLAVVVALTAVNQAFGTLEDGDLVELVNVSSPEFEGIQGDVIPGEFFLPPADAAAEGGANRRLSLTEGDFVEKVEDAGSTENEGVVGDYLPGPFFLPPADATPAERRLAPEQGQEDEGEWALTSVTQVDAHVPEEQRRHLCQYSVEIRSGITCFGSGQEVVARIQTCGSSGSPNAEWAGIYNNGAATNFWPPYNYNFLCGGQSCRTPVGAGTYDLGFTFTTRTQNGFWPLPTATPLRVYFHLGIGGSAISNIFYVGPTCGPSSTPPPPPPPPAPTAPAPAPAPTCSESVSTQNCWGLGQTIQATVNTCGSAVSPNPGWIGIYYAGTTNYAAALNWQYLCGGQSCASAVGPANGYTMFMNSGTRGSLGWPLPVGPSYQAIIHTASGSFRSGAFQITSTGSCTASPSSPTTPSASPPSSPSTSAPATTSSSSSNSPVVQTLYVQASAADCNAVRNGQVIVGQAAMSSQQFFFTFALGVNGQTLTAAQINSIVTQAFQGLIGTSLLNCSSRRMLIRKRANLIHPKAKHGGSHHHNHHHHKRHHHHHDRQLQQFGGNNDNDNNNNFGSFHRRLDDLPDNIIGNAEFLTDCGLDEACNNPFLEQCWMCTTTIIAYLKGPADPADVRDAIQAIIDSPDFFQELGLEEQIVFLQPEEDIGIITANPTDGPTAGPTSGPTSAPTSPTSGPTSGPTSAPTDAAAPPRGTPPSGPPPPPEEEPSGPEGPSEPCSPSESPTCPSPTGETPSEPEEPSGPAGPRDPGSRGDPHFKTWRNEHFEYHGQCDIVLASDPSFANGLGLDVHIRTKLIRFWSYIQSAVIRIGSDVLEIQGKPGKLEAEIHYWVNYEFQGELTEFAGFPVTLVPLRTRIDIDLDSIYPGQKISLSAFKEFVKVSFGEASEEAFGNTVGILGNFTTGATLSRDGVTVLNDFTELGQEWQVTPSDSHLFRETSHPQFPELCIEPDDPRGDRARRLDENSVTEEQAEAACAGLKDELDRKDCVYDILATQDMDMAGAY